jgi:ABC-type lipoprotein export system ATPase subunit
VAYYLLIVSHDTRLIPFADRVLRIEDGRIRADGFME